MDKVASITIPSVFEDLTVLGNITDKQRRYRDRLTEGGRPADDDAVKGPLYYLSEKGTLRVRDDVFPTGDGYEALEFLTERDYKDGKRGLPVFFESRYIFRAKCAARVKNVGVYHRLAQVTDGFTYADGWLFGDIDFINTPGRFTLALDVTFDDGTSRRVEFKFTVVSVKMDVEKDYTTILKTIEKERPGLVQNFLSKTFGDSGFEPNGESTAPAWYAILESIFDFYIGAVKQIVNNPHRRYRTVEEMRHPDHIRRWTPQLANRFASLPEDRQESAWLRVGRIEPEVDTQENRFVRMTLREIAGKLDEFSKAYAHGSGISDVCRDGISNQQRQLEELAEHPFFRGVGRYTGGAAQSLVLQQRAGYAQILTAWLTLKNALTPQGHDVEIGYRPLSALYEFWTFLVTRDTLRDILKTKLGYTESEDPKIVDLSHLMDGDDEGKSSSSATSTLCRMGYKYENGSRTVLLAYQQTYGTNESEENFSGMYDQRPDIVLSIHDGEEAYTYLFDAKYRVDEFDGKDASPRDAIDDMHRYRDAILYRREKAGLSHEIIGAYVLFPGRSGSGQSYDYRNMRELENVGAFPLLPNALSKGEYGEFLKTLLAMKTKREHLAKAMPPRGAEISLEPVVTEDMILTVNNLSYSEAKAWIDNKSFVIRKSELERDMSAYRQIRFRHSGNADMYVDIASARESRSDTLPEYFWKPSVPREELMVWFDLRATANRPGAESARV